MQQGPVFGIPARARNRIRRAARTLALWTFARHLRRGLDTKAPSPCFCAIHRSWAWLDPSRNEPTRSVTPGCHTVLPSWIHLISSRLVSTRLDALLSPENSIGACTLHPCIFSRRHHVPCRGWAPENVRYQPLPSPQSRRGGQHPDQPLTLKGPTEDRLCGRGEVLLVLQRQPQRLPLRVHSKLHSAQPRNGVDGRFTLLQ